MRRDRSRSTYRKWVLLGVVIVVLLLIGAAVWLVSRVVVVKADLEASQDLVTQLQAQVGDEDYAGAAATGDELQQRASSAANGTHDLTWRIAEIVPVAGPNLSAVRAVAESLDAIAGEVAVPAISLASTLDLGARNETGGFDLAPLAQAQDIAETATRVISDALGRLDAVNTDSTVAPVSAAVEKMQGVLEPAQTVVAGVSPALTLVGAVLGQDAPSNYLLAFQNNAESTPLGGTAASFLLMNGDNGSISIADQKSSDDFVKGTAVDVAVDQSALDLYSSYLLDHLNTSTSRPDFPTAAQIMSAYWQRDQGTAVDGVISVDPIALSYILRATGPLTLPSGDVIDSDNAVSLLVNEIYFRYPGAKDERQANAFFQSAAAAILEKVTTGSFDLPLMLDAVTEGVENGSIMMWNADPSEQALLDGNRLQGQLPSTNDDATVIGAYYRDISSSKIDYYLETGTTTTTDVCAAPANPTFTTTVTLHSTLTDDTAADLPNYIRSGGFGRYLFATEVYVYGPVGATLATQQVGQQGYRSDVAGSATDLGRPVAKFNVYLAPGETSTVTAAFTGAPGSYGPVEVRGTPMINTTQHALEPATCG